MQSNIKENLNRSISRFGFAALAINGLIGSGIFVLPALAAKSAGPLSPWMFLLCGILMSTVVLTFAKLSSFFSGTGGPIIYAEMAFGDALSFQTGWLLYFGRVTALAANAHALLFYLSLIFPIFEQNLWHQMAVAMIILSIAFFNLSGVDKAIKTVNFITYLKIVPLILFILIGIFYVNKTDIIPNAKWHVESLSSSLLLLIYAFIGFESAVVPAGEAHSPQKDIPKALIQTLIFTTVLYFLIQLISIAVLPDLQQSKSPLSDVAGVLLGPVGAMIMTFTAIISIFGNLSSVMVAAPRMTYSLSLHGNLPKWFGAISNKYKVPHYSIYFTTILALILALSGSFVVLAVVSSLARMIGYGICIGALPKISAKLNQFQNQFKLPGKMLIPSIAFLVTIGLALQAPMKSWIYTLIFIGVGFLLHGLEKNYLKKGS